MMGLSGLSTTVGDSKTYKGIKSDIPSFQTAYDNGEVVREEGWHKPDNSPCRCRKTTRKGAKRDVVIEYNGLTLYYLHQNLIMVEEDGTISINSCGYKTKTTKSRLNRYLPNGYHVYQRDYDWYLETPKEDKVEFEDGMTISQEERVTYSL